MVVVLPSDLLQKLHTRVPCREKQLQQLAIYYNQYLPAPPILVVNGLEHSAKLDSITALLEAVEINHAVVKCRECLSQRHLLAKIFAACIQRLDRVEDVENYDRIDGLNSLVTNLQRLFRDVGQKFVLVLDGIDKQQGASHTLLPALAKLSSLVPNLSVISTSSSSRTLAVRQSGVPVLDFPPYTRTEAITTLITNPIETTPSRLPESFPESPESQLKEIYNSFVVTVYDTLISHTSSISLRIFRRTCERLWPRFVWPLVSGEPVPGRVSSNNAVNVKWDFARLLASGRVLFQSQGEKVLSSSLTTDPGEAWTFAQLLSQHQDSRASSQPVSVPTLGPKQEVPLLKLFSSLLLVSSYLASHGPPKHDIIIFSRLSSSSTNKRKYLTSALSKSRSAGVRKTPTKRKPATGGAGDGGDETPSKKRQSTQKSNGGEGLANEKTPRSTRLLLEKTSSIPRPFTLERVIAVLRAIHPDGIPRTRGAADRVYAEMAELERLRLVVRCAGGVDGGNRGGGDDGILEEKWRVNVGREFVIDVGGRWGIGLDGWEIE